MNNLPADVTQRIKWGVSLLDKMAPPDWRKYINVKQLSIGSFNACVLGQIYGDYWTGAATLGIRGVEDLFGFAIRHTEDFEEYAFPEDALKNAYQELEREWRKVLVV